LDDFFFVKEMRPGLIIKLLNCNHCVIDMGAYNEVNRIWKKRFSIAVLLLF